MASGQSPRHREPGDPLSVFHGSLARRRVATPLLSYSKGDFPQAEKAADEILALPIYAELTHEMQDAVIESILTFLA
jgi:dTDP-4-amino-4,6-dideoxygalactose transaminase